VDEPFGGDALQSALSERREMAQAIGVVRRNHPALDELAAGTLITMAAAITHRTVAEVASATVVRRALDLGPASPPK
jgi:hypothetical protein